MKLLPAKTICASIAILCTPTNTLLAVPSLRTLAIYSLYNDPGVLAQKRLNDALIASAQANNINAVRQALTQGANPNAQNAEGISALHWAAHHNNAAMTKLLLEQEETNVNIQDIDGNTPLHESIKEPLKLNDFIGSTKLLLENNAYPNIQNKKGNTPLHKAIGLDNRAAAKLLLQHNAYPNMQNAEGNTPLHYIRNSAEMALDIAQYKFDPTIQNKEGQTALQKMQDENLIYATLVFSPHAPAPASSQGKKCSVQ
jgi:ankyrin repeat protein